MGEFFLFLVGLCVVEAGLVAITYFILGCTDYQDHD
jgi:hypothetical protein